MRQSGGTFLLAASSPSIPEAPIALLIPVFGAGVALALRRNARRSSTTLEASP
jgi:hypothetical protein